MSRSILMSGVNPFARLLQVQDALESSREAPSGWFASGLFGRGTFPPVNILRDDAGCVVRFEVPGLDPEAISVESQAQTITVSGKRSQGEGAGTLHRNERWSGEFKRSIELPKDLAPSKAEAEYRNGVISIRVPVSEEAKPHQITIQAN